MHAASVFIESRFLLCAVALLCLTSLSSARALDESSNIIISLHTDFAPTDVDNIVTDLNKQLSDKVILQRPMSGRSLVVRPVNPNVNTAELVASLKEMSPVLDVTIDEALHVTTVDDPRFAEQWQLQSPNTHEASLDVVNAWGITHGSPDVVVAVVDTGVDYSHPDLTGRLLPGFDFVSALSLTVEDGIAVPDNLDYLRSNDGDGSDEDASDPGDAVSDSERKQFDELQIDCSVTNSSWHGTAMASIIAANANDGLGIAGIDQNAKILPVRAIGKCGGYRSDMLDAIRWSAGVDDPFIPPNPTPARIINLSLGIEDHCTGADQRAIDDAIEAGAIVIAAVGNHGRNTDVQPSSPSHCQNVIGVMAIDENGYRASYSNYGRDADVAAPGGELQLGGNNILVATNKGVVTPSEEHGYRSATGTSVAAPHVAGVLALMLSVNPTLSNRELEALLLDNTRAFPISIENVDPVATANTTRIYSDEQTQADEFDSANDSSFNCDKDQCGSGILDAFAAVKAVDAHIPGTLLDSPSLAAAQSVPVSVGGFNGFGCTVSKRKAQDPILILLLVIGITMVFAKRLGNRF